MDDTIPLVSILPIPIPMPRVSIQSTSLLQYDTAVGGVYNNSWVESKGGTGVMPPTQPRGSK